MRLTFKSGRPIKAFVAGRNLIRRRIDLSNKHLILYWWNYRSEESQKTEIYGVNSLKQTLANRSNLKSLSSLPKKRLKSTAEGKRPQSPATLPPLPPRPRWPTEDERKQAFLDDEDVSKIEPHRLLCKICNCWIRLHPVVRYSQSVWPKHKAACKEATLQT